MFLRLSLVVVGIALCFAHNGSCEDDAPRLESADWTSSSETLIDAPASNLANPALYTSSMTSQQFGAPLISSALPSPAFSAPLLSSALPLSPARLMSQKPLYRSTAIGTKGQVREQIIEAPVKGGLSRSYPTKSLPVQQVIQETRALPAKGLPVQEPIQEIITREEQVVKGPARVLQTKSVPVVQEQQTIVSEPIRAVKGVRAPLAPVKGQQVIQEPAQETFREEIQAPILPAKGGASRFFAESVAAPAFVAPLRSNAARALNLAAQADSVISGINFGFSCENMPYGYYADVLNNCQVYHICKPTPINGVNMMQRFSFFCPAGTLFDQIKHVCMSATSADLTPCSLASNYFTHTVSRFAAPATAYMLPAASNLRGAWSGKATLPARAGLLVAPSKTTFREQVVQQEVQEPLVQEPLVQEPLVQEPLVQEPLVQEPLVQEPLVQEPLVQEPIVQDPLPLQVQQSSY